MSRRLRLSLLVLAGAALAAVLAVLVTLYVLLQPERFTAMLQAQARGAGLELSLASPARPGLLPRPGLELEGLTLAADGASAPILLAARGRLALPWRTLFGGPVAITRLEIDSPRVDLDALRAWLGALPPAPARATAVPRIDAGVRISHGSLVEGNEVLLDELQLDTGSLRSGRPFPLSLSARDAAGVPLRAELTAVPRIHGDALQLDGLGVHLSRGDALTLQLAGQAHWHGAADAGASLRGRLLRQGKAPYDVTLALTPADQHDPLLLALKLDGADSHVDLRLPPLALADWWSRLNRADAPPLGVPPLQGHVEADRLDVGPVTVEGFSLRTDDAPAPAASAAPPAPSAPHP
nr:AsmA family protein [Fulvimonas soli]